MGIDVCMYVCMYACVGRLVGMRVMSSCVFQIDMYQLKQFSSNFLICQVLFLALSSGKSRTSP